MRYKMKWEEKSIKYLGALITQKRDELHEITYKINDKI